MNAEGGVLFCHAGGHIVRRAAQQGTGCALGLRRQGLAVLLVEQNTHRALAVADHVVILVSGRKAYEADGEQARRDPDMVDSFLGIREMQ